MKKEEIHLDDLKRLLLGNAPPEFLLEVLVRSVIMYIVLVIIVRLLGKRTNAQLTVTERAVFITLGAIVALPMQGPATGILIGIIILICVLTFQRSLTWTFFKSARWEQLMQGKLTILVKDSVIDITALNKLLISREQLFESLRNEEVRHLGQVKRVYLEACGTFSIYRYEGARPGLPIVPKRDLGDIIWKDESHSVCARCGYPQLVNVPEGTSCPNCNNNTWIHPSKEYVQ